MSETATKNSLGARIVAATQMAVDLHLSMDRERNAPAACNASDKLDSETQQTAAIGGTDRVPADQRN